MLKQLSFCVFVFELALKFIGKGTYLYPIFGHRTAPTLKILLCSFCVIISVSLL